MKYLRSHASVSLISARDVHQIPAVQPSKSIFRAFGLGKSNHSLLKAAEEGQVLLMQRELDEGADFDFTDDSGDMALHKAARNGHLECLKSLIQKRADLNVNNREGRTPFAVAALQGHIDIMKKLLNHGASRTMTPGDEEEALYSACSEGDVAVARFLLATGASANSEDPLVIPLHKACDRGDRELVHLLVAENANVHAEDHHQETALVLACRKGFVSIIRTLALAMDGPPDVDVRDRNDDTPLLLACRTGQRRIAEALIAANANVNAKDRNGDTPLTLALQFGRYEENESNGRDYHAIVNMLMDAGAYANILGPDDVAPLLLAVKHSKTEFVKRLIAAGADVDRKAR